MANIIVAERIHNYITEKAQYYARLNTDDLSDEELIKIQGALEILMDLDMVLFEELLNCISVAV